jgi:hypothetical protein
MLPPLVDRHFLGETNPAFFRFVVSCDQQVFPVIPNAR